MATHNPQRIAPVHMHNPASSSSSMQQFTVGKLDAGMAILLGSRASLIEFPSLLLPQDVTSGSVVEITVKRNVEQERQNQQDFEQLQRDILDTFGRLGPTAPEIRLRAVTQTSVVLEWSQLELATAKLLSLDIYRNGARLAAIPNPLHNTSTKLSGLEVGADYAFHLVLKTTAGTMTSNVLRTKTHTMTDTSGIAVCFGAVDGDLEGPDSGDSATTAESTGPLPQIEALARDLLGQMGAKVSTKLQIDTTHYVCTSPRARTAPGAGPANGAGEGPTYRKALQLNIPIVRPEWVIACWEAKKMVPISAYYIDQDPPNHASVRNLLSKRRASSASLTQEAPSSAEVATHAAQGFTSPVDAEKEQPPPPPAPKDSQLETSSSLPPAALGDTVASDEVVGSEATEDSTVQVPQSVPSPGEAVDLRSASDVAGSDDDDASAKNPAGQEETPSAAPDKRSEEATAAETRQSGDSVQSRPAHQTAGDSLEDVSLSASAQDRTSSDEAQSAAGDEGTEEIDLS
ncbi:unnamed protein product [Parajaminaea phylloscopi]